MALKGTLKDFGIADIFQLIGHQQKTGVLMLRREDDGVDVWFENGLIVWACPMDENREEGLPVYLHRAGYIDDETLKETIREHRESLADTRTMLTENGSVTHGQVVEIERLHTMETIFGLFSWADGDFEFLQKDIKRYADSFSPIGAEHVLMDGFRIVDEWPQVRNAVGGMDTVICKAEGADEVVKRQLEMVIDEGAEEDEIDAAFMEFDAPAKKKGDKSGELTHEELTVLQVVKGRMSVQTVTDLSRMGKFEACKAIASLLSQKLLEKVESRKAKREARRRERAAEGLIERSETPGMILALALFFVFSFALFALRFPAFLESLEKTRRAVKEVDRYAAISQLERVQEALILYKNFAGRCPANLKELVANDFLSTSDLTYPWGRPYQYARMGAHCEVYPPEKTPGFRSP